MWPFGKRKKRGIRVQLVDFDKRSTFASEYMEPERLPASFEAETTMHRNGEDWLVLEARPMTAAEFCETGELTLVLRKVEKAAFADSDKILFSLPTITNAGPSIAPDTSKLEKETVELHEDDWRQVEWVSEEFVGDIEAELNAIRLIHEREREEYGFRKIHVRERIATPLAGRSITIEALKAAMGEHAVALDGVSVQGVAGIVTDSFAIRLFSSIEIYGIAPGGRVEVLGFQNVQTNNVGDADVKKLAEFAATNGLLLVDWCAARVIQPETAAYREFFLSDAQ